MIQVEQLHKRFGNIEVLKGVSLTAREGEVISLIGASGSGKSTLLRCINMLEVPDQGRILVDGESIHLNHTRPGAPLVSDAKQLVRIRSSLGMVFQNFNLWPHRTVLENLIEAPTQVLRESKAEATERAEALLERVGLAAKRNEYPAFLSGDSNNGWPSPGPWPCGPRSCCSMNPPRHSTRNWSGKCCG
jgi:arginine:pyruvate transaminase